MVNIAIEMFSFLCYILIIIIKLNVFFNGRDLFHMIYKKCTTKRHFILGNQGKSREKIQFFRLY